MRAPSVADLAELDAELGQGAVLRDAEAMAPFLAEPRRRFHMPARAVLLPADVEAVQAVCRWANRHRVALVPQGGSTGLVGGQMPLSGDEVIVSLTRLDGLRAIDAAAGHITVGAGMTLGAVQRHAKAAGAMFPLWIAPTERVRVGGLLATNAGGLNVLAYGSARQLCLGVEAVLADGRVYRGLNALKKDNTGYDLKDLLVGSEGTLGLITAATLVLRPLPAALETALVAVESPEAALALFYRLRDGLGPRLHAFELLPRLGFDIQLAHGLLPGDPTPARSAWYVLAEVALGVGDATGGLAAGLGGLRARLAASGEERAALWRAREQMSDCQTLEGASIKHDVSVPVEAVPALIARGSAAAAALVPGIRPCPFGHLGDGNIHFNFSQPVGADGAAFMAGAEALHRAIYAIVAELGGSVSAEHGIGQLKTGLLAAVKDPVALEMMRAIKAALDPLGILNPGKVLG